MRRSHFAVILVLGIFLNNQTAFSQTSNTTGTLKWPANPPVGIGTQLSFGPGPLNALHIHYDPTLFPLSLTQPPMIRLSEGDSATTQDFGLLGLMHDTNTTYSSLSTGDDLILHQNYGGDIIITNFSTPTAAFAHGTSIRFATTSDSAHRPLIPPTPHDLERMTITGNGNVGINLPPDSASGLGNPMEQFQLGGGSLPPPGYSDPMPGLSFYGGNRFEGMPYSGGIANRDYRFIGFNEYHNPWTGAFYRLARMSTSAISFADVAGGVVQLRAIPYDSNMNMTSSTPNTVFQISGQEGLSMWYYQDSLNPFHHLFDIFSPGYLPYGVTRNTNGLSYFHTPLYIGSDSSSNPGCDLQNLPVRPDLGDDSTWMLAVNGAALFKEAWVNALDWPDYVFLPGFKLMSIEEFGNFLETYHHLPELPPATTMNAGVPLGKTEADLTKQVEEMARYIIELHDEIKALKADVQDLKKGGK